MTREEAGRIVASLRSNWPNTKVTAETVETWWNAALERTTFDVALPTVLRLVAEDEFFPTVARFHAMRRAIERGAEPAPAEVEATTPHQQAEGHAAIARIRVLIEEVGSPWGTSENPHKPPTGWVQKHPTESYRDCPACQAMTA